jgi:hypothetical protein
MNKIKKKSMNDHQQPWEKQSMNKIKNQSIPTCTSVTVRTEIEKQSINKAKKSINTHQRYCPLRDRKAIN